MERITGNEVQSMMEAYASVYKSKEVEEEVISEEVAETEVVDENVLNYLGDKFKKGADQIKGFLAPGAGVNPNRAMSARGAGRAAFRDSNVPPKTKTSANANSDGSRPGGGMTDAQIKAAQDAANKARQQGQMSDLRGGGGNTGRSPISNLSNALDKPSVVSPKTGETTKFERRLPTAAELRAAQAARTKAKAGGATDREAGYQAVKAGVGVSKGTVADPKIAADAKRKAELAAIRAKAKADTMSKKPASDRSRMSGRARIREELDVFDIIKEHLILEHELSEDVAIQVMTLLDEETRGEIMEYTAKMTADGKEPAGDKLLRGIKDRVGGFLRNLNPNALKSKTVEPRK